MVIQNMHDDIEVEENFHWRKVSIKLLVPIAFTPIISNDHLLIVGYGSYL